MKIIIVLNDVIEQVIYVRNHQPWDKSTASLPLTRISRPSRLFAKLTCCLVQEFFTMVNLSRFRNEVTLIVNNLAKAVVTEIFTAAEKVSLNKQNPETEVNCYG